jgi:hypothetical protein
MRQMREETYHSISEFADKVIDALQNELGDEHLCYKRTNMQGAYFGAEIRYLWIGKDVTEWNKVGSVMFILPILGKVINDVVLARVFDIVRHNKIMLTVNYVGLDKEIRDRIASLSSNEELGEAINKKAEEFTIRIKFDQADPVASASKGIAKLLRAIKEAQKE